jgi:hypothetical protein
MAAIGTESNCRGVIRMTGNQITEFAFLTFQHDYTLLEILVFSAHFNSSGDGISIDHAGGIFDRCTGFGWNSREAFDVTYLTNGFRFHSSGKKNVFKFNI